jgi:hypothetical protein
MSLKSKACVWEMLIWFSSSIAVAVRGSAILAGVYRTGRRAGRPALADVIPGGTLSGLLPAVASQPNDTPKHAIQASPDNRRGGRWMMIPALRMLRALLADTAQDIHGPKITSGWEVINFKDESRPRRRCHRLTGDGTERARAALVPARTGPLFMRPAPGRTSTSRRVAQLGWTG